MKKLPINAILEELKKSINKNQQIILQAPPGAGKSTLVPLSLLNESWLDNKIIIMCEPRRIAARTLAIQMSELLNEELGNVVGYEIKGESYHSKHTKILIVTEGVLSKKLQNDQTLENVAMVIFDEFHERSINSDMNLAFCLQMQEFLREDLKILIMSATLNQSSLQTLLKDAITVSSEGKIYEVENFYLEPKVNFFNKKDLFNVLVNKCLDVINNEDGNILVFQEGAREINKLQKILIEKLKHKDIDVFVLYSSLDKKEQDKAIFSNNKRKIILSTNIAQTSLTIEGIKVVIDTGLQKVARYNYDNFMNHLELDFISLSSSIQRAGRAGRLSNGKCYKLWPKNKILQKDDEVEILRADISSLLLNMALWGADFCDLNFLDIPSNEVILKSKIVLQKLEMLDENFSINIFGKKALKLGLHPRLAYMVLKANELNFAYEAILLACLLEEQDIIKNSFSNCDLKNRFLILYNDDYTSSYIDLNKIKNIKKQTNKVFQTLGKIEKINKKNEVFDENLLAVFLLFAYPDRLAKRREKDMNTYVLSNKKGAILNKEDNLFNEEYLVVSSLFAKELNSHIFLALKIDLSLILKYFNKNIKILTSTSYNKEKNKFDIKKHNYFLDLELYFTYEEKLDEKNFNIALMSLIEKEGISFLPWTSKALSFQKRVNFFNKYSSSKEIKDLSDLYLLNNIKSILEAYLTGIKSIKEFKRLDMFSILSSLLTYKEKSILDKEAPLYIKVPSGSKILIEYLDSEAILSVKIQELFGLKITPSIINNKINLKLNLLTPALRPIQITSDLKSFWDNSYEEVRKELRGKYKRHYWPIDPYDAIATSKTKKHLMTIKT